MAILGPAGKPGNAIIWALSAVIVATIISFTVVVVTADDPETVFRFLAGPFLGNLGTFIVLIISAVLNRKVNAVADQVNKVERNTNGTTTALMQQNEQMTQHIMNNNSEGTTSP